MKDFQKYLISCDASVKEALVRLNELSGDLLTLFVVDKNSVLKGTITDGDIRRGFINGYNLENRIEVLLPKNFYFLNKNNLNINTIKGFRKECIKLVPFLDENGEILKVYDFTKRKSILPIDAVLMAGGRGERLRPLTDKVPKPMLIVGDKPIIEHNIDNLKFHGVDNFFITVNYLGEQISDFFGDGSKKGIKIESIREEKFLGTIGSVSLIKHFENDTVLVMNSDLFTNINYEDFYQDFVDSDADMSVATIPYNVSIPFAILKMNENVISSFEEKPSYTYYANAGIYLIKRKYFDRIPKDVMFHATDLLQSLIDDKKKVIKYPIVGYWVDIGRHEDFNKVQEFIKHLKEQV